MFVIQLSVNFLIFIIGITGIIIHRRSILYILICLELVLLSLSLSFILFSVYFDDMYGQIFSFFILTVAAAESAVGLAIIIAYYRVRGSISTNQTTTIRRQSKMVFKSKQINKNLEFIEFLKILLSSRDLHRIVVTFLRILILNLCMNEQCLDLTKFYLFANETKFR